jgi:5-(carboxyamino)imidazole ribonucleotide synthase
VKVGVLGGGQLAQMMALAGFPLGIKVIALESTQDCPAGLVTDVVVGDYTDQQKLKELAEQVDVVTYEFENVDVPSVESIETPNVYPAPNALSISQDRILEKCFFDSISVPTAQYFPVDSVQDLQQAIEKIGLPAILKTRRFGYDGKGQFMIKAQEEIEQAFSELGAKNLIVEQKINFDREVSCIAVRAVSGETAFYDLVENVHVGGILRTSTVITENSNVNQLAKSYAEKVLTELNYVGVIAIEFFEVKGKLIANEMAPRVHNSGHWTIEGAVTSQFENHLRAILDLPLGSADTVGYPMMFNVISKHPEISEILKIPYAHCHVYGKQERQGRKLGHITLSAINSESLTQEVKLLGSLLKE